MNARNELVYAAVWLMTNVSADSYQFWQEGKLLLRTCKDHGDKLTGEECPYCRIAELEKVAEAASIVWGNPTPDPRDDIDDLAKALRAAGYLKGEADE